MGLAERKVKQKIGNDPRNLTWSNDQSRFSYQHLQKFGWDPSKGLGASGEGNPNHIAVVKKADAGGIGVARAIKEGGEVGGAGEGLDALLKRLKSAGGGGGPIVFGDDEEDKESEAKEADEGEVVVQVQQTVVPAQAAPAPLRIMASRAKYQKAKRLAASSPAAMAEILGLPLSSLPASPSPLAVSLAASPDGSPAPQAPTHGAGLGAGSGASTPAPMGLGFRPPAGSLPASGTSTPDPATDRTAESMLTTSSLSLGEYFRQKMLRKRLEREGAVAPGQEVDLGVLDRAGRNSEVAKEFEGKKVVFGDDEAQAPADGPSAVAADQPKSKKDKADKKGKGKKRERESDDADGSGALAEVDAMLPVQPVAGPSQSAKAPEQLKAKRAKKDKKKDKKKAEAVLAADAAASTEPLVERWSPSAPSSQPALTADAVVATALHTPTAEQLLAAEKSAKSAARKARKDAKRSAMSEAKARKSAKKAMKREPGAGEVEAELEKAKRKKEDKAQRRAEKARAKAEAVCGASQPGTVEVAADAIKPEKKSKKSKEVKA